VPEIISANFDVMNKIRRIDLVPGIDRENDRLLAELFVHRLLHSSAQNFATTKTVNMSLDVITTFLQAHFLVVSPDTAEANELPVTLAALVGELAEEISATFGSFQRSFCQHFDDVLRLSECAKGTVIDARAYRSFVQDVPAFMEEERANFERQIRRSRKYREAFERELELRPGPWSTSEPVKLYFKAVSRISRNGRRVVMFINHKFHDHMDASRNRDVGRLGPTTRPEFLRLKPEKSIVPNSSAVF
jgi:hypothetical protein